MRPTWKKRLTLTLTALATMFGLAFMAAPAANATSAYPVRNRRDERTSLDLVNIN